MVFLFTYYFLMLLCASIPKLLNKGFFNKFQNTIYQITMSKFACLMIIFIHYHTLFLWWLAMRIKKFKCYGSCFHAQSEKVTARFKLKIWGLCWEKLAFERIQFRTLYKREPPNKLCIHHKKKKVIKMKGLIILLNLKITFMFHLSFCICQVHLINILL